MELGNRSRRVLIHISDIYNVAKLFYRYEYDVYRQDINAMSFNRREGESLQRVRSGPVIVALYSRLE